MWVCPICKEQNGTNLICKCCGFDESSNYEKYYTLTVVDIRIASSGRKQKRQYGWNDVYRRGLDYLTIGDYENAVKYMRLAAENGNADAQFAYGSLYYGGIRDNHKMAVRWFRKAALQGHALAQYYLGRCYFLGEGGLMGYAEGIKWLEESQRGGCKEAKHFLEQNVYGLADGQGTSGMHILNWYQMLADRGNVEAQIYLGDYFGSSGMPGGLAEAAKWYKRAADLGSSKGMWKTGSCYYHGQGVECDPEKAASYYKMAAMKNDGTAQALLGMCYEFGNGVEKNLYKAVIWYREAASHGNKEAGERADALSH